MKLSSHLALALLLAPSLALAQQQPRALSALRTCDGDAHGVDAVSDLGDVQLPRVFWLVRDWAASWASQREGTMEVGLSPLGPDGRRDPQQLRWLSPADHALSAFARVEWDGREYGAVFLDDREGSPRRRAWFVRTERPGALENVTGFALPLATQQASGAQTYAALAWSPASREWGVAWSEGAGTFFARVSAAGQLVPASVVRVGGASPAGALSESGNSPLVWAGTRWALVYSQEHAVALAQLGPDGRVQSELTVAAAEPVARATLAWDGAGFGLVWQSEGVRFMRVPDQGPNGPQVVLSTPGWAAGEGTVAWNGSEYVAAWNEQPVERRSQPMHPGGPLMAPPRPQGPLAPHLMLARLGADGAHPARVSLTCSGGYDWWPVLARGGADGRSLALTWQSGATAARHRARWLLLR